MTTRIFAFVAMAALSIPVLADIEKPELIECDAGKAARNAAMEATVGVHGICDKDKLVDRKKDDLGDRVEDAGDDVKDKVGNMKDHHDDDDHGRKRKDDDD